MRMKKIFTFLISALVLISFLNSCESQKPARGEEDVIYVVADSGDYARVEGALKMVFGKIIYTPQPENLFEIKRMKFSDLENVKRKKNIIILGPLNSEFPVAKYINSILDSTAKAMVMSDSAFVINKHDLWYKDQLVMILTAPDLEKLHKNILKHGDDLLYYFREASNQRLSKALYNSRFEKRDIEAKLLKNYGWTIYVQADYLLALDKPEDNFVWLRRAPNSDMERWIFIHWIENASPTFLDPDSIINERNRITKKYYRTASDTAYVELESEYRTVTEVNFNNRYALMTQGLWRFNDRSGGGPMISYTFYDEASGRIYMLDGSIFAPKYEKKGLIQQVDVMLHSFRTEQELNPELKKEILEALED